MRLPHFFLTLLLITSNIQAADIPAAVRDALRQTKIPESNIGIVVQELNGAAPLLEVNAKQAMNPASTMKLLTTVAALETLGPAYTWRTEAYIDGKLKSGVLDGNLVIKGYGNPKLNSEHLWLWLHELKNRGLREIHGNVILDRSAYAPQEDHPAAFDNEPNRAYNVMPDALLLNFNAIRFHFLPDEDRVNVFTEPALGGVILDNRLTLKKSGKCGNWPDHINIRLTGADNIIRLTGNYPALCGEREKAYNLLPHTQYFEAVFRALWQEMGNEFDGLMLDGITTSGAELFSTHYSQPLSEIIRDINKYSNNVMARQVFLSLSLNRELPAINVPGNLSDFSMAASSVTQTDNQALPASVERSELVIQRWLAQKGLDIPELVLENGSGLSRKERISPANLALLLKEIEYSPFSAEIEASLPIVGIDGTMKKRHENCAVTEHAHIKTGSLDGVKSMAGFLQSRSGKQWLVVFIVNHPNASRSQLAQDELLEWLADNH